MEIREKKEIPARVDWVVVGRKCDVCEAKQMGKSYSDDWHCVTHKHGGMGNDDIESVEYFLVCSPECYFKQLKKSLVGIRGYPDQEIDHMNGAFVERLLEYINQLKQ